MSEGEVCILTTCHEKQSQALSVKKSYLGKNTLIKVKRWKMTEKVEKEESIFFFLDILR